VVEWVRKSTAAQGLPERVTDPTILRKVAILMRPELAGRSMPPNRMNLRNGSPKTPGASASETRAAQGHFEYSAAKAKRDLAGPLLLDLSDDDRLQLERAITRLLQALEGLRSQNRSD
jgi:hypothetical protein